MSTIYLIPARGGSKGIKNKNIIEIGKLPLFVWSVIHAKFLSKKDDLIVVNSDNPKILEIAKALDVLPIKRPKNISGDKSSTEETIFHTLTEVEQLGHFRFLCLLQPTSPFRTKGTLRKLTNEFNADIYDSVLTVKSVHNLYWKNNKYAKPLYSSRKMRQDFDNYAESGMFYKSKISKIISSKNRVSGKTLLVENKEIESTEIDTQFDLKIANLLIHELEADWKKEVLETNKIIKSMM
jgi:CMP-N-acetylneuraminic acid synthetase